MRPSADAALLRLVEEARGADAAGFVGFSHIATCRDGWDKREVQILTWEEGRI